MKTTYLTSSNNHGSVLLVSLFICGALVTVLGGFLYLTQYQVSAVARSQDWNKTMVAAEAGTEEGLAMINRFANTTTALGNWPDRAALNGWSDLGDDVYSISRTIGSLSYKVYITNKNDAPIIKSTGYYRTGTSILAAIGVSQNQLGRGIRVDNAGGSFFRGGVLAKRGINITGNLSIDSFNSQDTNYSTGGRYDIAKRKDGGNVGTIASNVFSAILGTGSADVRGQLATGPLSTISVGGSFSAGSSAWVGAGTSGIQSGWSRNDLNLTVPDAPALPGGTYFALPAAGNVTINAGGGTVQYYTASYSMGSQNYLQVTNGTLLLDSRGQFTLNAQAEIRVAAGSKLIVYLSAGNNHLNGGGVVNSTGYATNCIFYGKPSCTQVEVNGGTAFIGQIYAPYADFQINGGADIVGSMVGNTFNMLGTFNFHFDESLSGPQSGSSIYRVVSWREVAP